MGEKKKKIAELSEILVQVCLPREQLEALCNSLDDCAAIGMASTASSFPQITSRWIALELENGVRSLLRRKYGSRLA